MISRVISRTLTTALRRAPQAYGLLTRPSFSFTRNIEKSSSNFVRVLQEEIKAE